MRLGRHPLRLIMVVTLLVIAGRAASAQTARVAVDGASIWSAPSVPSMVLATVDVGTTLDVVAQVGFWYRVRLPGDATRTGYILVRQVEIVPGGPPVPQAPGAPQSPAPPQAARRAAPRRAFVSVSAGFQPAGLEFANTVTFTDFVEQGTRAATYRTRGGPLLDVGYGVELGRGLFVGGAVSRSSSNTDVAIASQVPHPFYFDRMRTLEGTATTLARDELVLHFQVGQMVPINGRVHAVVAAGPSLFRLKQALVTDVTYTQEFPFDTVTFGSVVTTAQEDARVGFNAQLNVVTMVAAKVGVDSFVRFSYGSITFSASDGSDFSAPSGRVQVGVGLRAVF